MTKDAFMDGPRHGVGLLDLLGLFAWFILS